MQNMDLAIIPKVGIGAFKLNSKLSEIITELQDGVKVFGKVDIVTEENSGGPIYLYVKSERKITIKLKE